MVRWNAYRLRTRTFLFLVLICLSFAALTGLYLALMYDWKQQLATYKRQAAAEYTYHLLYAIRQQTALRSNDAEWRSALQEAAHAFTVPIRYYGPDGETIQMDLVPQHTALRAYTVQVPVVIDGRIDGYLTAYYDMDQGLHSPAIKQLERQLQSRSRYVLLACGLAALLLSVYAAYRWSRGIRRAGQMSETVVTGNRNIVVPPCGTLEIAGLIRTINSLLDDFERHEAWRKQLMQDLTHELRTPLTAVLSRLDAIIDGIYPLTTENMLSILADIERLYRLIEDMEKLSEAEGARFELNLKRINMSQMVKGVYEGFLFLSKEKDIRFVFDKPLTPFYLDIDPDRVAQILSNVIYNAIKYTPRGGTVVLGMERENGHMLLYCRDDGVGISEEDLPRIFDRFYRADKSRSRDSGGLGVGLSIAKALVEAHRGTIWAESAPGKGSTFWIRLPEPR
ncbi:two-component sensor histidine kinase [Paenibacillus dendritiformis]|uniref:sensor histidine kinase n=1 Tax=Paenibacillus dendritiformis TaxID=130049 RepID=UPI00105994A9|nr:ATP-binding protein [Paenibacillus dendritiformis]TDL57604.1 two-component sensor histidine kinase [Paenibacillus dendritiformis]